MRILVTGASGYVGHHILSALTKNPNLEIYGLARNGAKSQAASGKDLGSVPGVQYLVGDVVTGLGLETAMQHMDAVIHLVAIIAERGTQTFERVHVQGTRNVTEAAKKAGVKRYLHMSALGANLNSASGYSSSKAKAEELVKNSGLNYTIFRPSLIFGYGDDFFGRVLKNLVSQGPITPQIGDGHFPFRPIWVGDVANIFVQALEKPETTGKTFELVGPQEYSFRELLDIEMKALGIKKPKIPVPIFFMDLAVPAMQILGSLAPITTHQYAMLKAGNTGDPTDMQAAFKIEWRNLEKELPVVLGKTV